MPARRWFFRLLLCAATAAAAPAAQAASPYEGLIPVATQGAEFREPALRAALEQVLVRVSGDRGINRNGRTAAILALAPTLVVSQGYETRQTPGGSILFLKAQFDARGVEAAMRQQGLPIWGSGRAPHLVWLALRNAAGTALVDRASAEALVPGALAAAAERGINLLFPTAERPGASADDVWSQNEAVLFAASRQYPEAQAVIVARAGSEGGRATSRWALLSTDGARESWSANGASLDAALAEGVHLLADRVASRMATRPGAPTQDLALVVNGINAFADYGRVLNFLRGLNAAQAVHVEAVSGSAVTYRLRAADPESLARAIAGGSVLRRDAVPGLSYTFIR